MENAFDMLLDLLGELISEKEVRWIILCYDKKISDDLGFSYQKIDACLYWTTKGNPDEMQYMQNIQMAFRKSIMEK